MTKMTRRTSLVGLVGLVALAALLTACGSSAKPTSSPTTPASVPASTAPTSSSTASSSSTIVTTTPTTSPTEALTTAVWPTAASSTRYHSAVDAARGFATAYVHFVAPIVGAFRAGDARSGEVDVRATAAGPATTVVVRKLGADDTWWVLGAGTPNITIAEPAALTSIASPVTLRGTSTAFEANVQVSVRQDDATKPLAETYVMGGANGTRGPFDAKVPFTAPTAHAGAVVMYTISSADGHVAEASVVRVMFSGA